MCEEYTVARDDALATCREEFGARQRASIADHLPGDDHKSLVVSTEANGIQSDLVLLPVYLLTYRHRDNVYRFLINGQTGKLFGYKPISRWKIGLVAAAVLLALAAVVGFIMTRM